MLQRRQRKENPTDPRPYIRDVAASRERPGAGVAATITLGMVLLALAAGFVIGLAAFAVMNLSTWLTALVWNGATGDMPTPWFPLAVCTLGGVAIGVWTWWSHDSVKPLEEVMAEFKATGAYKTNGVARPVVTFLLLLVFGGSIGFEAGLTGLVTAGCCWIRDRLKAAGLREAAMADVTIAASIAAIFGTTGGLPRFDSITATPAELLWAIPCIVVAYAMMLLFHGSTRLFRGIGGRLRLGGHHGCRPDAHGHGDHHGVPGGRNPQAAARAGRLVPVLPRERAALDGPGRRQRRGAAGSAAVPAAGR